MCHTHWYEKMRLVNELIYRVDGSCMGGCGDMSSCAILRGHYGTKN
jgi:hypothetical protein